MCAACTSENVVHINQSSEQYGNCALGSCTAHNYWHFCQIRQSWERGFWHTHTPHTHTHTPTHAHTHTHTTHTHTHIHTLTHTHTHPHTPHTHTQTHTRTYTHPIGFLWTSDQHVAEAASCRTHNKQKRNALCGTRTGHPSNRPAADLQLRPHVHRNRLFLCYHNYWTNIIVTCNKIVFSLQLSVLIENTKLRRNM